MRQGGVRKQKTRSRGFTGKNSIMVQHAEHVGREKEIDKAWWRLSPTSSRRLLTLEVERGQGRVLDQQLDPWNQGHADRQKLWPQRKADTARQAGLGRTHPFSSLLLPSDPMLLMPICQNQLENRRQGNHKNPLQRGQPPEAQSRIGKGGNWSGEGGRVTSFLCTVYPDVQRQNDYWWCSLFHQHVSYAHSLIFILRWDVAN